MKFEDLLEVCGGFGKHQMVMLIWYQLSIWLLCPSILFMIFAGYVPRCVLFEAISNSSFPQNLSIDSSFENETWQFPSLENITNSTGPPVCLKLDKLMFSIVTQFNFTDMQAKVLPKIIITVQMLGVLVGPFAAGAISDHFGRRLAFLITFTGMMVSGFAEAFCPSWQPFAALLFVNGFFLGGTLSVHYVLMMEMLTAKWRAIVYIGGWPLGYVWTGVLGYVTRDYRTLAIVVNSAAVLPLLFAIFWLFESPKWLLERGRTDAALEIMQKVAERNGVERSVAAKQLSTYSRLLQDEFGLKSKCSRYQQHRRQYHYGHLFRNRQAAIHTAAMLFSWFCVSSITYNIVFNIGDLMGDPTINVMLFGLMRLPLSLLIPFCDKRFRRFGRQLIHRTGLVGTITCLVILTVLISIDEEARKSVACLVLSLFGMCFTTMVWIAVEMYSAEIFPTVIRNMGNALCNVFARVGGLSSPQIMLLAVFWRPSPYLFMSIVGVLNLVVAFLVLPETKGRPLPDMGNETKRERCDTCDIVMD